MDISIVIVCRKDRGYLQQAIDSAEAQDFSGSFEIVLQQDELTMAQNHNIAFKKCKGEYIKWLHDDDMLLPCCLADLWTARGADVIFADAINFLEPGQNNYEDDTNIVKSRMPLDRKDILERYCIHAGTVMYKRQVLLDNPLDESLLTCEDFDLNVRLFFKGYKFAYVDQVVSKYRIHNKMKSYSSYGYVEKDIYLARRIQRDTIIEKYERFINGH
jgi:glycosyltransferase involved in cell wall biosynthesis